jgi:hypothetical protein
MPSRTRQGPSKSRIDRTRRVLGLLLLGIPLSGFGGIESWLAPSKKLWPRWTRHDERSTRSIDHTPWDRLLATHLVPAEINLFRYAQVDAVDRQRLKTYIGDLASVPISSYRHAEQLAYWINLYNALTVDLVVDRYPVKSIRDIAISPGLFSYGPWDKKLVQVEMEQLSLNDIEHRILRPIWQDANIHYALNCASLGCPNLAREAYTADNTAALMKRGAADFINGHGVRFEGSRVVVSSIYAWFTADFGGTEAAVLDHLRRYARPPLQQRLVGLSSIDGDSYDWRLNDAS